MRILDGAVGTELARRGFALAPPAFAIAANEEAPQLVAQIHQAYLKAGAQALTLNSFGLSGGLELGTREAALAIEARAQAAWGLASPFAKQAPLWGALSLGLDEDPGARLLAETRALLKVGLGHLRFETLCELDPILAKQDELRSLLDQHQPQLTISLCPAKKTTTELLQALEDSALLQYSGFFAIGINCVNLERLGTALGELSAWFDAAKRPVDLGIELRPHLSGIAEDGSWDPHACPPDELIQETQSLLAPLPAQLRQRIAVGTCCGGGPEHIEALRKAFSS